MPSSCPSLEDLAAFVDGDLGSSARTAVIQHLGDCPDCLELVAATGRAVRATQTGSREERFADRRHGKWALAASLVLLVGAFFVYRAVRLPNPLPAAVLAAELAEIPGLSNGVWQGQVSRGVEEPQPIDRASFQLGGLLVDFQLTALQENAARLEEVSRKTAALLDRSGLMQAESLFFVAAAERARAGQPLKSLPKELDKIEARLRSRFVPFDLDFGAFAEAGRLASAGGDRRFFNARSNRHLLDVAVHSKREVLSADALAALEAIEKGWSPEPSPALGDGFTRLMKAFDD